MLAVCVCVGVGVCVGGCACVCVYDTGIRIKSSFETIGFFFCELDLFFQS